MKRAATGIFANGSDSDSDDMGGDSNVKRSRQDQLVHEIQGIDIISDHQKPKSTAPLVIPLIRQNIWRVAAGQDTDGTGITESPSLDLSSNARPDNGTSTPLQSQPLRPPFPSERQLGFGLQVVDRPAHNHTAAGTDPTSLSSAIDPSNEALPAVELSLREQALKEILDEADGKVLLSEAAVISIPILAQNAVPGTSVLVSDLEKYRHDITLRPDECSLDDYKRVPIDHFGEAMLRGMGWADGKAVGKSQKGLLAPVVVKARPHLLGLGATPAPVLENKQKKYIRPGEKRLPDPLSEKDTQKSTDVPRKKAYSENHGDNKSRTSSQKNKLVVGAAVKIIGGSNRGSTGTVVDIKEKASDTVVKVEIDKSREIVRVWKDQVALADTQTVPLSGSINQSETSWLMSHLRVRIVSKSFKNGSFYNNKAIIQDVISKDKCIVRVEGTLELLDGVRQKHLETYVPSVGKRVMIVAHKDSSIRGMIGVILEKQSDKELAVVQLESDFSIETVSYDEITEYVE
ncbi:hypothetical protein BASA50_010826 [Batrachochytrium salamandrivorans]|uniref:G-patch domain-containing protein n=1 Tax=Batrachochytrium salamandrivorans TaxID=1357716 RepID=A0ABQ8F074_9FUNG|nr:hypothetical protein BASA50_010826 [Batrachochytrium salamandrivorans]